jgi:cell division FtsZ-interacting protein ZapD
MNNTDLKELQKISLEIEKLISEMEKNYNQVHHSERVFDFFSEIEPFVNSTEAITIKWQNLAYQLIKDKPVKYIYREQIDQTVENINILAVIHFQPDTRFKRFTDLIASVKYIIGTLNDHLIKENI